LLVCGQQGLEAGAQGGVAVAGAVQKGGAFLRWFLQRQDKQGFFAGGFLGW
jgi:hypothetical protein